MEAQAAGLPVVASRVGGIPSLIDDGKTGYLFEPEDSDALAETIIKIHENKNRLKEIGAAGRESIRQKYSAQRMVEQTLALYQELASK